MNTGIVQIFIFLEYSYYLDWFFFLANKKVWNESSLAYVHGNQHSALLLGLNRVHFKFLFVLFSSRSFFSLSYPWTRVVSCSWGDKFMVDYISFCLAPSFEKDFILDIYSLHIKTLKYCLHLEQDVTATMCIQASYTAEKR